MVVDLYSFQMPAVIHGIILKPRELRTGLMYYVTSPQGWVAMWKQTISRRMVFYCYHMTCIVQIKSLKINICMVIWNRKLTKKVSFIQIQGVWSCSISHRDGCMMYEQMYEKHNYKCEEPGFSIYLILQMDFW